MSHYSRARLQGLTASKTKNKACDQTELFHVISLNNDWKVHESPATSVSMNQKMVLVPRVGRRRPYKMMTMGSGMKMHRKSPRQTQRLRGSWNLLSTKKRRERPSME